MRQPGYSLFELIMVIVIIGVLAAAALTWYIDVREQALIQGLETQASNFASAVHASRADWLLKKHPGGIPTQPGEKLEVTLDGARIYVNEAGWPANTSPELDSSIATQTASECHELWQGLMSKPAPATVEGVSAEGEQRYHVSVGRGVCRYELVGELDDGYFFEYNLATGNILTNQTKLE